MPEILNETEYTQHVEDGGELMYLYSVTLEKGGGEERKGVVYFARHHMAHKHVTEHAEAVNEGWTAQFISGRGLAGIRKG